MPSSASTGRSTSCRVAASRWRPGSDRPLASRATWTSWSAPHTITSDSPESTALLAAVKAAVRTVPGAGLDPHGITETAIWTYERADGRRLAIPFRVPGVPEGHTRTWSAT
jgi:hypothetical protein